MKDRIRLIVEIWDDRGLTKRIQGHMHNIPDGIKTESLARNLMATADNELNNPTQQTGMSHHD